MCSSKLAEKKTDFNTIFEIKIEYNFYDDISTVKWLNLNELL